MTVRTSIKPTQTIVMEDFLGIDFTRSETETDIRRSPESVNMIASRAGRPQLRTGYTRAIDENDDASEIAGFAGEVLGIHFFCDTMIVHRGRAYCAFNIDEETGLYAFSGRSFALGAKTGKSSSFFMNGRTYLLDGTKYVSYSDDEGFKEVEGFIPTTTIGAKYNGGGTSFEAVNLLTRRRKNSFTSDGTKKTFKLDGVPDASKEIIATVSGERKNVTVSANLVTFADNPPDDGGADSIVITFYAKGGAENRAKIEGCRICSVYGAGNPTRVFVAGSEKAPSTDYYSGLYDAEYFPDNAYTKIGTEDSPILGYLGQYGAQIIVKKEKGDRSALFLRQAELINTTLADGTQIKETLFTVCEGIRGVGAVCEKGIINAAGRSLFLSKNGLLSLESNAVTNQQSIKNMSGHINGEFLSLNLENAFIEEHENKLFIALNGKAFVAMTDVESASGYEWFYWEDIPTGCLKSHGGRLYLADDRGVFCLKSEEEFGMNAYTDEGRAIYAKWWSPVLDGGMPMRKKSINALGTGVSFKPGLRTRARVLLRTDKCPIVDLGEYTADVFSFADADFTRFTFKSNKLVQIGISPKKLKNIESFQIGVEHDTAGDFFGLLAMTVNFTPGRMIRRQI